MRKDKYHKKMSLSSAEICLDCFIEGEELPSVKDALETILWAYNLDKDSEKEKSLREDIAERVEDKMCYMHTCLNERDIILDIIKNDVHPREIHCNKDCNDDECKVKMEMKNNA